VPILGRGNKAKQYKNKKWTRGQVPSTKPPQFLKVMIPLCLYKFQTQAFGVWPLAHACYSSLPYISEPLQGGGDQNIGKQ